MIILCKNQGYVKGLKVFFLVGVQFWKAISKHTNQQRDLVDGLKRENQQTKHHSKGVASVENQLNSVLTQNMWLNSSREKSPSHLFLFIAFVLAVMVVWAREVLSSSWLFLQDTLSLAEGCWFIECYKTTPFHLLSRLTSHKSPRY